MHTGDGHAAKLVNDFPSFTALLASSEALVLADRAGLDRATTLYVLDASSGHNSATEYKLPEHVLNGTYDMGFPLEHVEKDIGLFTEFGESTGAPLVIGSLVRQLVGYARTEQGDDADMMRVYDSFENVMGRDSNSVDTHEWQRYRRRTRESESGPGRRDTPWARSSGPPSTVDGSVRVSRSHTTGRVDRHAIFSHSDAKRDVWTAQRARHSRRCSTNSRTGIPMGSPVRTGP